MPIIKSAKKRVRVSAKATTRNSKTRRNLRESIKSLKSAISSGKPDKVNEALRQVNSAIDKAAKKNVIHKNKAARKKSQVAKMVSVSGTKVKPSNKEKVVKKPIAKKMPVKKATSVKKSASKK